MVTVKTLSVTFYSLFFIDEALCKKVLLLQVELYLCTFQVCIYGY